MADITMPKMGFDMTEGTIVRWLKQVGDEIKKGEAIAEIETDKVTIEIEAFDSGKLTKIVADEGAVVPVGATIAILDGDGAAAAPSAGQPAAQASAGGQAATAETPSGQPAQTQDAGEGGEAASTAAAQSQDTTQGPGATGGAQQSRQPTGDAPREGYGTDVTADEELGRRQAPVGSTPVARGEQIEPRDRANGGTVIASPLAKRLARENNINIAQLTGSGPGGRVVRSDVEQFLSSGKQAAPPQPQPTAQAAPMAQPQPPQAQPPQPQAAPAPEAGPGTHREGLSRLRQTIARRLVQSKGPVPHFYVTSEIDMGAAMALRKQLNAAGNVKITVNDMLVKASAIAMTKFPALNASFADDALLYHDYINVGIAVATDNGLLAPAVTDVDKKSLGTISAEAKELISRTRVGKATPDELGRGTYSTSNLGMYPVDSFVAIINPPQAAIIAVGAVAEQPVVRNGEIVIGQMMKATISVDHRVADGAVAAEYMQELKRLLENPMLILL